MVVFRRGCRLSCCGTRPALRDSNSPRGETRQPAARQTLERVYLYRNAICLYIVIWYTQLYKYSDYKK